MLVGSGPLETETARRSPRSARDWPTCDFAGSRDDVPELLPAFDVFALSSRFEGLPIALLEAMATGLACVATTVGGIPEVVTDGRGRACWSSRATRRPRRPRSVELLADDRRAAHGRAGRRAAGAR